MTFIKEINISDCASILIAIISIIIATLALTTSLKKNSFDESRNKEQLMIKILDQYNELLNFYIETKLLIYQINNIEQRKKYVEVNKLMLDVINEIDGIIISFESSLDITTYEYGVKKILNLEKELILQKLIIIEEINKTAQ